MDIFFYAGIVTCITQFLKKKMNKEGKNVLLINLVVSLATGLVIGHEEGFLSLLSYGLVIFFVSSGMYDCYHDYKKGKG